VLHARPDSLPRAAAAPGPGRVRCAREIEEVSALRLVELQRTRKGFQNGFGDTACVAALEAGVVVDADAGEERDLLSAQPGNPPVTAVRAQLRLLRRDLRSPGGQKLADLAPGVDSTRVTPPGSG
jgi:hypothetical protein